MGTTRVAVAGAVLILLLTGCEPLETGSSGRSGNSGSTRTSQRVEYQTSKEKSSKERSSNGGSRSGQSVVRSRQSVVVRSGSTARVTSRGSGKVTCRIVLNGRTVASKSGTGSVTCSARVGG
jgi:hypothetical protein